MILDAASALGRENGKWDSVYLDSNKLIFSKNNAQVTISKTDLDQIESDSELLALKSAKLEKRAEINSKRETDANKNVTLNSVEYDNNESSRFAVLAAIVNGQIIGNGFTIDWIAVDDSKNTLTLSDLIQLGQSMIARKEAAIYNANTHKITVKSLKDLKQVKDYDFSD